MIADLKPYPEYKESGLAWLGRVPAHWGVARSKRLFSARRDLAQPEDVQLSATQAYGVIPQSDFEARVGRRVVRISMHLEKRRHVEKDDFVVSMRSFQGGIERAWASGAIRSSYVVLKPESGVDIGFFAHLFKSYPYIRALQATADFIRDGQDLNFTNFCRVDLAVVPVHEQAAIARFLGWANGRLDLAIRAKRKVIALLTEQKQAIIHRAVTRGLDPSVRLKPSGVPWIGDIPQHWEVWRISRFARVGNGSTPSRSNPAYWKSGIYPWLNSSQVNRDLVDSSDQFVTGQALRECHLPKVSPDSVLVAITGQGKTRGKSAVLRIEATINQHIAYITPHLTVATPAYIHLTLTGAYPHLRALSEDSGSTKGAITCQDLKRFKLPIPPTSEQRTLRAKIEVETNTLAITMARLEREIELLREYRTRLVADVVTGKLDVREAAARLPDEVVPESVQDEVDLVDDSDPAGMEDDE